MTICTPSSLFASARYEGHTQNLTSFTVPNSLAKRRKKWIAVAIAWALRKNRREATGASEPKSSKPPPVHIPLHILCNPVQHSECHMKGAFVPAVDQRRAPVEFAIY